MKTTKKVLVLGGKTGLLGQKLVRKLSHCEASNEYNYEVSTLGREDFDIFNRVLFEEKLEEINPDIIFNTIAYTQVDKAEEERDKAYKVNRDFPLMIGKLIQNTDTTLVHYSTDFVFDGLKSTPYTEEDEPNPLCVYGSSKLAGENAIRDLALKNYLIIRTSWLFGSGRKNFVSTILQKAKEGNELKVVFDQVGSPSSTLGVAANSVLLLNEKVQGLYHLTNSGRASWFELAHEALDIAGIQAKVTPIPTSDLNQIAKRPAYSVLSNDKFTNLTNITPRSWSHALRDYIYHLKEFSEFNRNEQYHG